MIIASAESGVRSPKIEKYQADLVVTGGGLAGVCASITAAREGLNVVLVQDRPVLGGNASSEIRMWTLGATSHMGNNNRWAREGGVIDEIMVENLYRNKEGNPLMLDVLLLEKVDAEKNIKLLLNTSVYEVTKSEPNNIDSVKGFCSQNSTHYEIAAPLFCDASGDGIVGFCSGAAFRMGAEKKEEFAELFAPDESYGELLGHTIYFYSKDTGKPVSFKAPSFALKDIEQIPKFRSIRSDQQGCNFWWFEYGGRKDTVHDTEEIKWELWSVVYGVWDHIKNSGEFPEAENLTLEWVGHIPGKRESRRFEGPYMLKQQDVVEQTQFEDAVAFGGWSLDLHPSDGIYSNGSSCNQWHSKGIYQIPYRCFYSKNIENLFLAGRIISASHVAFGSTRVMATCAHGGQAVGMAAAICHESSSKPADLIEPARMAELQNRLNLTGQSIPSVEIDVSRNLLDSATLTASSELVLNHLPKANTWRSMVYPCAQMLPMAKGVKYAITPSFKADVASSLRVELRVSEKRQNHTPEKVIEVHKFELQPGESSFTISFDSAVDEDQYGYICFFANAGVKIAESDFRTTGVLSVFRKENKAVSNFGKQEAPEGIGVDSFEFWTAERRPGGKNFAMQIEPAIEVFNTSNLKNGWLRPVSQPNAWVADPSDRPAVLNVEWNQVQTVKSIKLFLDPDYDHPMETVQMGHPESIMPFCVESLRILDDQDEIVYSIKDNHQGLVSICFDKEISTKSLIFELKSSKAGIPAAVFYIDIG